MGDFFRPAEWRTAAKDHRCIYCGEAIAKGEIHQEQTGVWDGKAFRNKFHPECFAALCQDGEGEFTAYSEERPRTPTQDTTP